MAYNRKRVSGDVTLGWIAARLLLFGLVVGCLLGITFLKRQNLKKGDELALLDRELKLAEEKTNRLDAQLARYTTPRALESRMAAVGLVMVQPSESQIRRLPDPPSETSRSKRLKILAKSEIPRRRSTLP